MITKPIIYISAALYGYAPANAQNGILPRGKPNSEKKNHQKNHSYANIDCSRFFLNRSHPYSYLTSDGKLLYFNTRLPKMFTDKSRNDFLVKFNIDKKIVHKIASLKLPKNPYLIPNNQKVTGITFLSFQTENKCNFGLGRAFSLDLRQYSSSNLPHQQKPSANLRKSLSNDTYFISTIDGLPGISTPQQGYFLSIDASSLQKRRSFIFPKNYWPLTYNKADRSHILLRPTKENPMLIKFNKGQEAFRQPLGKYKLLQNRKNVALARIHQEANQLTIKESRVWTNKEDGIYRIRIPKEYPIEQAFFEVDFFHGKLIVHSKTPTISKRWKKALIYDYKKNLKVAELTIPYGLYLENAVPTNDGKGAIFILKQFRNRSLSAIKFYWYKKKKWQPIHIKIY